MSARALADPPRDPHDGWPTSPSTPHPAGPNGPRAELDRLTGPLPAGAAACARWGEELVAIAGRHPLLVTDRLRSARRVARRVVAMGAGGGSR